MRPQLAPRCGVAFLIIFCPLVARIAVRVGPRTAVRVGSLVARTGRAPLAPHGQSALRTRVGHFC